jgi:WD40 repeat protein
LTGKAPAADDGLSRVEIAKRGKPATALVEVQVPGGFGYGSAFCIHPSGLFLTNFHVVEGALGDVTLVLNSGLKTQKSFRARVARIDKGPDLALLRAADAKDLPALTLGSDENLEELMEVIAFGFPFGRMLAPGRQQYPAISVNPGSITSLRRNQEGALSALQLDVAINPGNSGGPLLDKNGKVVGVVEAMVVTRGGSRTGVNFGIPVSAAARFVARPDFQFEPPLVGPNNMYRPVRFEARLVPILPAKAPYTVDLILKSPTGPERTLRMEAAGDNKYQVTALPLSPPSGPLTVRLMAQMPDGLLNGSAGDRVFKVGSRELKLSEIRSVQLGLQPRVLLRDGKTIEGAVTGLDAVPIRQGDQTRAVNLAKASELKFSPAAESDLLHYTLLVRQSGKEVLRHSATLLIHDLLAADTGSGPAAVKPPVLEGKKVVRKLPAEIADAVVGGAGRYLVLHLPKLHQLAVFDVSAATVIGHIPMEDDAGRFAAGLEAVMVLLPGSGTIEHWNLGTLQREWTTTLPVKGVIKAAAMGSASKGPVLIHWAAGTKQLDRAFFAVLDVQSMLLLANALKVHPMMGHSYRDLVHLRASANGKLFGLWCTSHTPSGLCTIVLNDKGAQAHYAHTSIGRVLPSPDGKVVFTGSGMYAPEVKMADFLQPRAAESMLPASQGDSYLILPVQRPDLSRPRANPQTATTLTVTLRFRGKDRPLATIADLDLPTQAEDWIKHDFTFDKHVHLIPEARLIVTIPPTNDQLILQRLNDSVFEPQVEHQVGEIYHLDWQDEQQEFPANLWWTRFTPDGSAFLAGGDGGPKGDIRMWQVATGKLLRQFIPEGQPRLGGGLFLPDGKQLLSWYSSDRNLYFWDVATGKLVRKLAGPGAGPVTVAVSADSKRCLAGGNDNVIHLYDLETGKELDKLQGHGDKCQGVFSPDGKTVLSYSPDKTLRLWDANTGKLWHKLEGHQAACSGVFSPDSKQVLSFSADKTVRLWDASTGAALSALDGPTDEVTFASFLPAGDKVVAWGKDRRVRIWDARTGKLLNQYELGGKPGEAPNAALTPDGRRVLVSNYSKTVHLMDLETGKFAEVQRYENPTNVQGFSISPDGNYAAAETFRAGVYLWRLPK